MTRFIGLAAVILSISLIFSLTIFADDFNDLKMVYKKGVEKMNMGEFDEAKEFFIRSIELNRSFGLGYHGLGVCYYQLGYLDEAITYIEKAQDLGVDNARIHYILGVAYTRTDQYDEARASYLKAIEMEPDFDKPYHNLGLLYYQDKEWYKAQRYLELALKMNPESHRIMFALGLVYIKKKDTTAAFDMITSLRQRRDETMAAKLEQVLRPPPNLPDYYKEPDPLYFEPELPTPARTASSSSSSPGTISITGRVRVTMRGVPPEGSE